MNYDYKYWRVTTYMIISFERTVFIDYFYGDESNMKDWKDNKLCEIMASNPNYNTLVTKCSEITQYEYHHQDEYYIEDFLYIIDDMLYSTYDILVAASVTDGRRLASNEDIEDWLRDKGKKAYAISSKDYSKSAKEYLAKAFDTKKNNGMSITTPPTQLYGNDILLCSDGEAYPDGTITNYTDYYDPEAK